MSRTPSPFKPFTVCVVVYGDDERDTVMEWIENVPIHSYNICNFGLDDSDATVFEIDFVIASDAILFKLTFGGA